LLVISTDSYYDARIQKNIFGYFYYYIKNAVNSSEVK